MNTGVVASPAVLVSAAFGLGLVVGSFLNVVIHRLPRGESLIWPGSRCPACARDVRIRDNVPLLAYLWLRGRCRDCGARISIRYPIVEALTGALFAAVALRRGMTPTTGLWMLFAAALLVAAAIDYEHRILPDEITLGGLVVGMFGMPLLASFEGAEFVGALRSAAEGAALGGGMLWIVGFGHARFCALLRRRFEHWPGEGEDWPRPRSLDYWTWFPGMGFGDVKLLAMIGAFVGPVGVVRVVLAASVLGLLFGVAWAAAKRSWSVPFGFGPALAAGALAVVLAPPAWLGLF